MRAIDGPGGEEVLTGRVLSDRDFIAEHYEQSGLPDALWMYLDGDYGTNDSIITDHLSDYSNFLAEAATQKEVRNDEIIRFGIDLLTNDMNVALSERLGYDSAGSLTEAILIKIGRAQPTPHRYIAGLGDEYWANQFTQDLDGQKLVRREPDETEQHYLGHYIDAVIHGFIYAPFTYAYIVR